jgi:hypothetical protein
MENYNPFETINQHLASNEQRLASIERLLQKFIQPNHLPQPHKTNEGGIDLAQEVLKVYSKSSIYKFSMEGRIPCEKRGRKLWFNRETLENWIKQGMPDVSQLAAADRLAKSIRR